MVRMFRKEKMMANQEMFYNIISAELKRLENSIQKLQRKIRSVSDDAKEKYQMELDRIIKNKEELESRLKTAKVKAENAGKEIKSGIEYGIDDLKKAINKITSKVK
jgi:hypothetical protein